MDQKLSMEITVVVGEKMRSKWRHKSLRYFKLTSMTLDQYHSATSRMMKALEPLIDEFLNQGYEMYFRGERITKDGE